MLELNFQSYTPQTLLFYLYKLLPRMTQVHGETLYLHTSREQYSNEVV